jgi:hypothetical protein
MLFENLRSLKTLTFIHSCRRNLSRMDTKQSSIAEFYELEKIKSAFPFLNPELMRRILARHVQMQVRQVQ